jgi:hypothetical protein
MPDFTFTSHGSICTIEATSEAAEIFAEENFAVEDWQGIPQHFTTDHRVALDLRDQLEAFGWEVV